MNRYKVCKSGGKRVDYVYASCITKAAQEYMKRLPHTAIMKLLSREHVTITFEGNPTFLSDYVIIAD